MATKNDGGGHKYQAAEYRCSGCGDYYHTRRGRDVCEKSHKE